MRGGIILVVSVPFLPALCDLLSGFYLLPTYLMCFSSRWWHKDMSSANIMAEGEYSPYKCGKGNSRRIH